MIRSYYRPQTIDEALTLLADPNARPLGGGTDLIQDTENTFDVVDLQSLGLDKIHKAGERLGIGATVKMQELLESKHIPVALKTALNNEKTINLRNMATVAGSLVTCTGLSSFAGVLLALDAKVYFEPDHNNINLGNYLPMRLLEKPSSPASISVKLITSIEIPLHTNIGFESVARSPSDKPIIFSSLCKWPSGRFRLVIGGWGAAPSVAMDGNDISGIESAARNVAHDAADDWASAEYRREIAPILAKRCLNQIMNQNRTSSNGKPDTSKKGSNLES